MSTNITKMLAVATLVLMCCSNAGRPVEAEIDVANRQLHEQAPVQKAISETPRVPVIVRWEVLDGEPITQESMTLRAVVEKRGRWPFPIDLTMTIPTGVRVVSGDTSTTIQPGSGDATADIEIYIDSIPADDLVAIIDSQSAGAGIHGTAAYRFGRPEPQVPQIERRGPRIKLGNHDYGRAILMD